MKSMFIIEEIRFLHKNDKVYIFTRMTRCTFLRKYFKSKERVLWTIVT